MIVFGIHHNFFIVLPIRQKICRCNGFLFQGEMFAPKNRVRPRNFARLHYVCNLVEITNEVVYLSFLNTDKLNIFCKTK